MLKFFLLFICFIGGFHIVYAQKDSLSREDRASLDSMLMNDDFLKMFLQQDKSFVDVSVTAGNQLFSLYNNSANAAQSKPQLVITPAVGYYHKSGFGLSGNVFITTDSGSVKAYQYAVSPFYKFKRKRFDGSVAYTRYITGNTKELSRNPFQNDLYGNLRYLRTWLQPGLSAGLTTGKFVDSVRIGATYRKTDFRISSFSISASVDHDFYFYGLLNSKDGLSVSPAMLVVAGSQSVKADGLKRFSSSPRLLNALKNRFNSNTGFHFQSLAGSLAIKYGLGKFYFSPNLYLDYYLPETTDKKLATVFSFTAGLSF